MKKLALAIVVTYNAESWLAGCMDSLSKIQDLVDVAVFDNASKDNTVKIIKEDYSSVVKYLIPCPSNLGFGKAHNELFFHSISSGYDYFFLLNQDAEIERDAFEGLVSTLSKLDDYAVLSPMHYANQTELDMAFSRYFSRNYEEAPLNNNVVSVEFVNAAIWLAKTKVIQQLGGFHPLFPHYGEDSNLAQRLIVAGYKIGILKTAQAFHYRNQTPAPFWLDQSPQRFYISNLVQVLSPRNKGLKILYRLFVCYAKVLMHLVKKKNAVDLKPHLRYFSRLISVYFKTLFSQKTILSVPQSIGKMQIINLQK